MARQKSTDEIGFLRKQREQIDARLKAAAARRKLKNRQDDQRRKSIADAFALEYMAAKPEGGLSRVFAEWLDTHIGRPLDRELFAALLCPQPANGQMLQDGQAMPANDNEKPDGPSQDGQMKAQMNGEVNPSSPE